MLWGEISLLAIECSFKVLLNLCYLCRCIQDCTGFGGRHGVMKPLLTGPLYSETSCVHWNMILWLLWAANFPGEALCCLTLSAAGRSPWGLL